MKKALTMTSNAPDDDFEKLVIGAQRLAVVELPKKPDANWGWRGVFSYGDTRVGECRLREGGVFSFICVDCGLFVGDIEEEGSEIVAQTALSPMAHEFEGQVDEISEIPAKTIVENHVGEDDNCLVDGTSDKPEEDAPPTAVEVVNRTDDPVTIKVYDANDSGGTAYKLLRSTIAEGTLPPGSRKAFCLQSSKDTAETNFDVEVRIGMKKAKCEVVGGQVIFVDGILADG
jgi:hypothetical protein